MPRRRLVRRLRRAAMILSALALAAAAPPPRAPASPPAAAAPPTPAVRLRSPVTPDAGGAQCRSGCDREYYFCLSGEVAESCADRWGQCRAKCSP